MSDAHHGERSDKTAIRHLGHSALAAIEALLDEKDPVRSHEPISHAVRCLVALRDHLIENQRSGQAIDRSMLDKVNALLSLSCAIEYPLVGVRWERMRMTRDALMELVE